MNEAVVVTIPTLVWALPVMLIAYVVWVWFLLARVRPWLVVHGDRWINRRRKRASEQLEEGASGE